MRAYILCMAKVSNSVIACYKLNGQLVKTYPSARAASRSRHLHPRTIDKATRGDVLTAKNLIWKRVDKYNVPTFIEPLQREKHSNKRKRVAKVDENNSVLEIYDSISEAAKKNKIDPHTLRDRLNGKYSSKNKDKFVYIN